MNIGFYKCITIHIPACNDDHIFLTVEMHFDVWTGVFLEEEEEMDIELSEAEQLQLRLDQLLAAILNQSSSRSKHLHKILT